MPASLARNILPTATPVSWRKPVRAWDYYKIQQESRRAYHVGKTRISQQPPTAGLVAWPCPWAANWHRWDLDVELVEPGAEINLNGLYLTG